MTHLWARGQGEGKKGKQKSNLHCLGRDLHFPFEKSFFCPEEFGYFCILCLIIAIYPPLHFCLQK